MDKYIYNEKNGLWYKLQEDYLFFSLQFIIYVISIANNINFLRK